MAAVIGMAMVKVMCVCTRECESCARSSAHARVRVHEEATERPRRPTLHRSLKVDWWANNINPSCSSDQSNICTLSQAPMGLSSIGRARPAPEGFPADSPERDTTGEQLFFRRRPELEPLVLHLALLALSKAFKHCDHRLRRVQARPWPCACRTCPCT